MKVTFKQFLEDITIDDDAYHKDDSDTVIKGGATVRDNGARLIKAKWKDVPLQKPFPFSGYTVKYNAQKTPQWSGGKSYDIALFDDETGKIVVNIECSAHDYQVPGGTIKGLSTEQLSSAKEYRGKGLVVALYKCLAENGQNLFSATLQTSGGASVWKRLVGVVDAEVYVVLPSHAAESKHFTVPRGVDLDHYDYVLVKGSEERLNRAAYDVDGDAFWFVTPGISPQMKKYVVTT